MERRGIVSETEFARLFTQRRTCPFCGTEGSSIAVGEFWRIECTGCEAFTGLGVSVEDAWKKWNRRYGE
jgi:hypothetical protein